jgi:hypothetical protein
MLCLLLSAAAPAAARPVPKRPRPEVFGVRLEMGKREAHARLGKLGTLEKEERRGNQEVWAVGDRRVSHLIVGYDPEDRVRYVTALARADAPRIRYDEIASLKTARLASAPGSYKYTWEVEGKRKHESEEQREREERERRERESKEHRERGEKEGRESERGIEEEGYVVIARGRDPQFLDSYSVKKVSEEEVD